MKEFIRTLKTSVTSLLLLILIFVSIEPSIGNAIEDQFIVTQVVTAEISFTAPSTDLTMTPALAGITGGTSYGTTSVRVLTNNGLGYSMTLTASSSAGMIGNTNGGTIPAYAPAVDGVPDFAFTVPTTGQSARFGYTVVASTSEDLGTKFKDNGSVCNTGSGNTGGTCWLNASTTAVTIINRSTATPGSGATTTIAFQVIIPQSPVPTVPQDTYLATTTLTATVNL